KRRHGPHYSQAISEVDQAHGLRAQFVRRTAVSGSWRTGHGPLEAAVESRLRVEQAALSGRFNIVDPQELRLRVKPRARPLGLGPIRISRNHCTVFCRYFL